MSSLFNMPWSQVFDGSGNTLAGAKLYFYEAGTSTLKNVYADINLSTALSNPVIADAGGRFAPIYFDGLPYKIALYTANDVLIWTADHVENETSEVDAELAIQAITKTSISAGYTQTQAKDPDNFPKAVYKYANAANFYNETGSTDNTYILEGLNAYERPNDYFVGQQVIFVCSRANTDAAVTVNVEELGAKTVKRFDGSDLVVGDMYGMVQLVYDGTYFLLFSENNMPRIGDIKPSLQSTSHNGWLLCDGQAVSRTLYATLYALIGTTYGDGDGSTTFNIPDYRDIKMIEQTELGVGGNGKAVQFTSTGTDELLIGGTGYNTGQGSMYVWGQATGDLPISSSTGGPSNALGVVSDSTKSGLKADITSYKTMNWFIKAL